MSRYRPIVFLPDVVRDIVLPNRPGAYALGRGEPFRLEYVGRSDNCLQTRLAAHNHLYAFDYFIFRYAETPFEAFVRECELFHALEQSTPNMMNKYHPAAPAGSGARCPYCEFGLGIRRVFRTG